MKKIILYILPVFIVLILSLPAVFPLFHSGFFPIHDDTQVARVYEMAKSLRDGMFPVRWVADLGYGYGYPIFSFYAPLAYYFGGVFVLFGLNALLATKIMFFVGILLPGICMYLLTREFWGVWGGIVSGIFYQYATYHAVEIYVRGDVSEFWAYGILPLIFFSFYRIFLNLESETLTGNKSNIKNQISKIQIKNKKWILLGGLSYAAVILSHNLTALMVTPFLLAFGIILVFLSKNKLYVIRYTLYALSLGILISAFYWLPALMEIKYTNILSQIGGKANFIDHFVCIQQFWYSPWGYGGSVPGCIDGMSFMIGKIHILVFVLSILIFIYLIKVSKSNLQKSIFILNILGFIFTIFIQTSQSLFIWQHLFYMKYFQYPWRFLIFSSFFASILSGGVISFFSKVKYISGVLCISAIIFILVLQPKFFVPQKNILFSSDYYTSLNQLQWITSRISDEYLPRGFNIPKNLHEIVHGNKIVLSSFGKIKILEDKTQKLSFILDSTFSQNVLLRVSSFPAWHAYIDGKSTLIRNNSKGIILHLSHGRHNVSLIFKETPVELIANSFSLIGIFVFIFITILVV